MLYKALRTTEERDGLPKTQEEEGATQLGHRLCLCSVIGMLSVSQKVGEMISLNTPLTLSTQVQLSTTVSKFEN